MLEVLHARTEFGVSGYFVRLSLELIQHLSTPTIRPCPAAPKVKVKTCNGAILSSGPTAQAVYHQCTNIAPCQHLHLFSPSLTFVLVMIPNKTLPDPQISTVKRDCAIGLTP